MERLSPDTLRLVLDTMVEGVVLHDASGDVVWANPSAARILGPAVLLSARSSGSHEGPWVAVREDGSTIDWDDHPAMVALRTGETQRDVILGVTRADGQRAWMSVNATPMVHAGGRSPAAVVVSYADVTQVREGALKLRSLEGQLRHAQKMEAIGQLTGGIAHDFNNLLTAILTNADLLAEAVPADDGDAQAELQDLRRAARRGAELVRKLMVFSRRDRVELVRVDLRDLLWDAARLLRRVVPESIEIQANVDKNLPAIDADPAGLEQVLLNLATNARDAMPGSGVLRIHAEQRHMDQAEADAIGWGRPGPYVCVTVSDTGVGMDRAVLERIYDPFFTTKPVGQGTGLGMSIVYGVVQQHEGHIRIESEPGKGTRVELRFRPGGAVVAQPREEEFTAVRGGSETIMLVEDNEGVRSAARRILERQGYKVIAATTGEAALQLYQVHAQEVALVVADVIMPGMSGFDLVSALRRQGMAPRFLLTSGYTARQDESDALDVPLLPKPWTPGQLSRRVREILDGKR